MKTYHWNARGPVGMGGSVQLSWPKEETWGEETRYPIFIWMEIVPACLLLPLSTWEKYCAVCKTFLRLLFAQQNSFLLPILISFRPRWWWNPKRGKNFLCLLMPIVIEWGKYCFLPCVLVQIYFGHEFDETKKGFVFFRRLARWPLLIETQAYWKRLFFNV